MALVLGAVVAMLVFGAAIGVYRNDARTYVNGALPDIMDGWDVRRFFELGGTGVLDRTEPEAVAARFHGYRQQLGELVRYRPAAGDLHAGSGCEGGPWIYGTYHTVATFERGQATVVVAVAHVDGRWQIEDLDVGLRIAPGQAPRSAPAGATGAVGASDGDLR